MDINSIVKRIVKAKMVESFKDKNALAVLADLKKAFKIAEKAAEKRIKELNKQGDKFVVHDDDKKEVGRLQDVFGFASIKFSGRNRKFINAFKELSGGDSTIDVPGGRVYLPTKGSGSGYMLDFFLDNLRKKYGGASNYLSVVEAKADAALSFLKGKWIKDGRVNSRVD